MRTMREPFPKRRAITWRIRSDETVPPGSRPRPIQTLGPNGWVIVRDDVISKVVIEVRNSGKITVAPADLIQSPKFEFARRRVLTARIISDATELPARIDYVEWGDEINILLSRPLKPSEHFTFEVELSGVPDRVTSGIRFSPGIRQGTLRRIFASPTTGLWFAGLVLLGVAVLSVRDLLISEQVHGRLLPGDAPSVVGAIVGTTGAITTMVGGLTIAVARLIKARGGADAARTRAQADLERAKAEMRRAQAELIRARNGLAPGVAPIGSGSAKEAADSAGD